MGGLSLTAIWLIVCSEVHVQGCPCGVFSFCNCILTRKQLRRSQGQSSGWDILSPGSAVPDTSGGNAEALWVGNQWINCSLVEEGQIWESSFYINKWSRNLKHSYPSPETGGVLTLNSIAVDNLVSCGADDIFLILQGFHGNEASPPQFSRTAFLSHPLPLSVTDGFCSLITKKLGEVPGLPARDFLSLYTSECSLRKSNSFLNLNLFFPRLP